MFDEVVERLATLGYGVYAGADDWIINFIIGKVTAAVKNECNVNEIPDGLRYIVIDMVCGEFLLNKKGAGLLDGFAADLSAAIVKQLQEGDTNVTFAVDAIASPEQRLDRMIELLMSYGKGQFAAFRRLKW